MNKIYLLRIFLIWEFAKIAMGVEIVKNIILLAVARDFVPVELDYYYLNISPL